MSTELPLEAVQDCDQLECIEIGLLLEGIYQYYGYDFRNYALSSIRRRVWHRLRAENLLTISSLQEKVLHDESCMERLYCDFSINVTGMFRDPEFFLALRQKVVPFLRDIPFLRIWDAGCSSGEEVLSLAILLHEEGLLNKTRIYATDMNAKILERARVGQYSLEKMQSYTRNYLNSGGLQAFSEYYEVKSQGVVFDSILSKNVVFAQHNLATDRSFNEFHLILCRNVLIYFNRLLQERVHSLFYDSLCHNGFLGLGSKEEVRLTEYAKCYEEVDKLSKIYRKYR